MTHTYLRKIAGKFQTTATVILLILLAGTGVAMAQQTGECLRAEVPAVMILPDGSEHPAGTLRICMSGAFSPVSALHRTSVNGTPIGLFRSRMGTSEGEISSREMPFVLFRRDDADRLILVGYAWPEGRKMRTFRMRQVERKGAAPLVAQTHEDLLKDTILLAALVD